MGLPQFEQIIIFFKEIRFCFFNWRLSDYHIIFLNFKINNDLIFLAEIFIGVKIKTIFLYLCIDLLCHIIIGDIIIV